ncbi:helix-turn-helix domain-containing protein [Acinetobacter sp. MD2]|uniref:helix-turn-helix domain-containing protein n=1 Tax=Acinetobacter sp. MD2 TaxID=2600066 RepID=UPI002D1F1A29|nr:helix-turn-helix domain-containing protein [Acinetobacter sp. MD2]MEB3767065.1 helix-turn-helix domain-containing protein [Acinetobacter sp. MD2]
MEVNPNSQQSTVTPTTPNTLGNVQRPGEYLRHIRLNQKRELADVSQALSLPVKTLEALEKDEYTALPEATFIKGYYRTYAKLLGVDASAIIQRFDEIYANDTGLLPNHALKDSPIRMMGKLPGSNSGRNKKWLKRGVLALLAAVVLVLLVTGVQKWSAKRHQAQATAQPQSTVDVVSVGQNAASSGDELVVKFARPTSVKIVDSTGKVLATGRQDSSLDLKGVSPFQIRLDDADAVASLSLNNEAISLSPYTVNGKADFRLSR